MHATSQEVQESKNQKTNPNNHLPKETDEGKFKQQKDAFFVVNWLIAYAIKYIQ